MCIRDRFITVSNSVFDLNCKLSLSMLFGCVLLCLYISNCSVVLSLRLLGIKFTFIINTN